MGIRRWQAPRLRDPEWGRGRLRAESPGPGTCCLVARKGYGLERQAGDFVGVIKASPYFSAVVGEGARPAGLLQVIKQVWQGYFSPKDANICMVKLMA
jgi:hypothetical protein